ncbi:MAG: hypothetical protein HYY88_15285 [candidate division NC10 bacterium]|nr:hypothetical protein [candidate division NC10 bacterium]
MAPRQRPKVLRPARRRTWAIRPVARPHSTPKGEKGYDRRRARRRIRDESPDENQNG